VAVAQLETLGQIRAMNKLAKIWDFIWGMLLVGMLPMFVFCLAIVFLGVVGPDLEGGWLHKFFVSFAFVACLAAPLATLYFICRWRMSHRLLPVSVMAVEIVLGLIVSAAFFVFVTAIWGMASIN